MFFFIVLAVDFSWNFCEICYTCFECLDDFFFFFCGLRSTLLQLICDRAPAYILRLSPHTLLSVLSAGVFVLACQTAALSSNCLYLLSQRHPELQRHSHSPAGLVPPQFHHPVSLGSTASHPPEPAPEPLPSCTVSPAQT